MFHMLSCFNLDADTGVPEFKSRVKALGDHLKKSDLLLSVGALGKRQRHPVMDTDKERNHEYFFVMSFRDRRQCDQAVAEMYKTEQPLDEIHKAVYANIVDPVFICWEDV
ncbi:MAG: hypothetical protein AAF438_10415 [Pseudomonadota bacterium]